MRTNDAAAEALQELADLVAISDGDPYRVRAYEKAARSVAGYPLDLDTLDRKGLMAIPAVGEHIADKLLELRKAGRIAALEELHAQLPAGLRALLGIPGLGPKRAHQVHVELGISSMPELLAALHDGRLRDLKGWGETSERNLDRAIQRMQEVGARMPLAVALDIAEDLAAQLAALPPVSRVDYAGSLRRMRDAVGDIDLLVAANEEPDPVMDRFCTIPLVDRVLAHGPTKSSVVTTKGIQVDLRVVPAAVWGAALQYSTGSKVHNIRIRELAVRAGLKLPSMGCSESTTTNCWHRQTKWRSTPSSGCRGSRRRCVKTAGRSKPRWMAIYPTWWRWPTSWAISICIPISPTGLPTWTTWSPPLPAMDIAIARSPITRRC